MAASRKNGIGSGELYEVGPGRPPIEHQFKLGNPGRPKGSRNRLGEDFVQALYEDFREHGAMAIEKVREADPAAYLRLIASVIPKGEIHTASNYDDLSDEELDALSLDLARQIVADAEGHGQKALLAPMSDGPPLVYRQRPQST